MGEPPYHLRKTRKCASPWIFTMKTHSWLPFVHAILLQKQSTIFGFGREVKREKERQESVDLLQKNVYLFKFDLRLVYLIY